MGTPPDNLAVSQQPIGDHPFVIIAPARHGLAGRRRRRVGNAGERERSHA
ncbi:hypothetical protein [Hyphomicrobium sp. 1Nfss2.1]